MPWANAAPTPNVRTNKKTVTFKAIRFIVLLRMWIVINQADLFRLLSHIIIDKNYIPVVKSQKW